MLIAVPNVSEGEDLTRVAAVGAAFAPARLLDTHSDADHGRSVFTLAARQGELAGALASGAREAARRIDLTRHAGAHPHVGALDVAPVVYLDRTTRGPAVAEALTAAALIGADAGLPVFLYGELATRPENRERAALRRGGTPGLAARVASGELAPDYGPHAIDPQRGAVLVTARPPLIAFNLDLATGDVALAKRIAAELRRLPGVRALGLLVHGRAQVSTNVHDPDRTPLPGIVRHVAQRAPIARAEIVGLPPRRALDGFPPDVPLAYSRTIEDALGSESPHGPDQEEASA
jgi:glutamate formiminotransferase